MGFAVSGDVITSVAAGGAASHVGLRRGMRVLAVDLVRTNATLRQKARERGPMWAARRLSAEAAADAPVDCAALEGDAKAECEAKAAEAAEAEPAKEGKSGKAQRSNTNRMESEYTDE